MRRLLCVFLLLLSTGPAFAQAPAAPPPPPAWATIVDAQQKHVETLLAELRLTAEFKKYDAALAVLNAMKARIDAEAKAAKPAEPAKPTTGSK